MEGAEPLPARPRSPMKNVLLLWLCAAAIVVGAAVTSWVTSS
jgi:hypothetical protein